MLQASTPRLILASQSSARRAVLAAAGLAFTAEFPAVDEAEAKRAVRAEGGSPEDAAIMLAALKAQRVARRAPDALVIGADQILVCEGRWYDKPETSDAAREQLRALRGKQHVLVTGMVCQRGDGRVFQHLARPRLVMRAFSEAFLEDYLAAEGDAVTSSVGAYRLEGLGVQLFERIEGEHAAILGLPLLPLLGFLRQHGALAS